jgi:hypothetical protein
MRLTRRGEKAGCIATNFYQHPQVRDRADCTQAAILRILRILCRASRYRLVR